MKKRTGRFSSRQIRMSGKKKVVDEMNYFIMKTDRRLRRLPQVEMPREQSGVGEMKTSIAYVREDGGMSIEYADYLERPVLLIADKFQKILQKYQPDLGMQQVILVEKQTGKQTPYCMMSPRKIVCADQEASQYDSKGNVRNFVLDPKKAADETIFLAEDYGGQMIVRLDVAESILRRDANGIWFEPVKTTERS